MTIAIAWVRKVGTCEELVFVSDSRLSGDGDNFDMCPKILSLPRNDCAISFAGYTGHAFPMMLQLSLAIDSHAPAKRGSLDLATLRTHALKIFGRMARELNRSEYVNTSEDADPLATFLFGGYSWVKKKFRFWRIRYDSRQGIFAAHPVDWLMYSHEAGGIVFRKGKFRGDVENLGHIAFVGDQASVARDLLIQKMNANAIESHQPKPLDMEPFEVVRDMLRDPDHSETIGGAPQIMKVYQYMRTAPLGVFWPDKATGKVHLQGRQLLGYERTERWVLDPDTLISEQHIPRETTTSLRDESEDAT